MKRLTAMLATLLTLALLCAPAAQAGGPQYQGRVEKDNHTAFGFDVKKDAGIRKVKNISAALPFTCEGGNPGGTGFVFARGSLRVKADGSFGGKLQQDTLARRGGPTGDIRVDGKLGKRGKAKGTLASELFFQPRGDTERCYTGILKWSVKKGRQVTLPARASHRSLGR